MSLKLHCSKQGEEAEHLGSYPLHTQEFTWHIYFSLQSIMLYLGL